MVADGDCVSVGRGGGVEGEQEERRKLALSKVEVRKVARVEGMTLVAMGLNMGGILTD